MENATNNAAFLEDDPQTWMLCRFFTCFRPVGRKLWPNRFVPGERNHPPWVMCCRPCKYAHVLHAFVYRRSSV